MVGYRATNRFVHNEIVQYLNAITMDVPAMRVILADVSFINCSNSFPVYLQLCRNLQ